MNEIKLRFYSGLGLFQTNERNVSANLTNISEDLVEDRVMKVEEIFGEEGLKKLIAGEEIILDLGR